MVALIGAAITAAASIYSAHEQSRAQDRATAAQREASDKQQRVNQSIAEQNSAQQQQANNRANAGIVNAANYFQQGTEGNSSVLTGGLGISNDSLNLGGSQLLGGSNKGNMK